MLLKIIESLKMVAPLHQLCYSTIKVNWIWILSDFIYWNNEQMFCPVVAFLETVDK